MKKSFILYNDNYEPIRNLTQEQKGTLLDAIFLYSLGEDLPDMDTTTEMAFKFVKINIDNCTEKWEEVRAKRSEAGKLGGAPKGNTNAAKNKQKQAKQAKQAVNVNVNDNVNVNVNDNVTTTDVVQPNQAKQPIACFKDELKADEVMLAAISSATAIQKDKLIELIPAFENELAINGKKHKNYTEYRLHFKNYASKKAEIERQQQTKSQSNGEFRTSAERRRGKTYDLSQIKPEDYHESF